MFNEKIIFKDSKFNVFSDNQRSIKYGLNEVKEQRKIIEKYIQKHGEFLDSMKPISVKENDHKIIKKMKSAASAAGVGPMATVAGSLAEVFINEMVKKGAKDCIVDNGGDVVVHGSAVIGLYAKGFENIGFNVRDIAVCSSSSNMGHSKSFGKCDLASVFSKNGALADACATACANNVNSIEDIKKVLDWVVSIEGVIGAVIVKDGRIGMIGDLPEMVKVDNVKDKVTVHPSAKNRSA